MRSSCISTYGSLRHPSINTCLPAHLVLIGFVAQVFDQAQHAFCCRTFPVGPGVWTQRLVPERRRRPLSHTLCTFWMKKQGLVKVRLPLEEDLVFASISKASAPHPQVLHQPQVLDLMSHQHIVKTPCKGHQRSSREFSGSKLSGVTYMCWLNVGRTYRKKSISLATGSKVFSEDFRDTRPHLAAWLHWV